MLAVEEERITQLKWYNFRRERFTDKFFIDAFDSEATAFYFGENLNNLEELLRAEQIRAAVCSEKFAEKFTEKFGEISLPGIVVSNGKKLYHRLIPTVIKKQLKMCGKNGDATLAVSEGDSGLALSLIRDLRDDFRYITIIAKNKRKASEISEKVLDEYGLPLIIAAPSGRTRCDIAVKTGREPLNLPKNTILIDGNPEHTITNKNDVISWLEVSVAHNLPYKIDSLAFAECMEILTGKTAKYKLSGIR